MFKYDNNIAYWNFCAAGNYASRFYRYAMNDVRELQVQLMDAAIAAVTVLESYVVNNNPDSDTIVQMVTKLSLDQGNAVIKAWRDLLPQLITK